MSIEELNLKMAEAAQLSEYKEKKLVFGEGAVNARICMVGEAPGGDEEKQGHPFVGKAGKNLDEFLKVVGLDRRDIYITNVVKLRPVTLSPKTGKPVNRTPNKKEIAFFSPYLMEELKLIRPEIIVTLGNTPLRAVSGVPQASIGEMHGRVHTYNGFTLFPLYHPAAIIYNQGLKDTYYEDLEKIKEIL